ncbi:unnamed protein product [Protopolystoma xenopodis]|uniref:Uncharacterized protein n=1 Tax=Protopolystoma xenopodis TaxID=117903 RepID=A0A3S5B417_9PLAT|nr:unnamed protein product [Protopolystoma xenopodis]
MSLHDTVDSAWLAEPCVRPTDTRAHSEAESCLSLGHLMGSDEKTSFGPRCHDYRVSRGRVHLGLTATFSTGRREFVFVFLVNYRWPWGPALTMPVTRRSNRGHRAVRRGSIRTNLQPHLQDNPSTGSGGTNLPIPQTSLF